jgi:phosphatidylglycerol:prolipoprotein diacylglycerol transferase
MKSTLSGWFIAIVGALGLFVLASWPWWSGQRILDPVALSILGFQIRWYGIIIALAVGAAFYYLDQNYRKVMPALLENQFLNIVTWVVVAGIVGARLGFVFTQWPLFAHNLAQIANFQAGGLSIHGALIAGGLALWLSLRPLKDKVTFLAFADLASVALALAQGIGRFGNFFNYEAFGPPATLPWKMYVPEAYRPKGLEAVGYFHPTFIYEAILDFAVFLVLLRLGQGKPGQRFFIYMILYGVVRFFVEFLRIDSEAAFGLTFAQWISLLFVIAGTAGLLIVKKGYPRWKS